VGKTSCDSLSETHSNSSTDKTDSNNITEKLSKVVLNANNLIKFLSHIVADSFIGGTGENKRHAASQ
jgi:hypothetical protein